MKFWMWFIGGNELLGRCLRKECVFNGYFSERKIDFLQNMLESPGNQITKNVFRSERAKLRDEWHQIFRKKLKRGKQHL